MRAERSDGRSGSARARGERSRGVGRCREARIRRRRSSSGRTRLRRFGGDEGGQSLVEFVLVVPTALLLFFGVVELGRYCTARLALRHGVHEAARFAATGKVLPDRLGASMSRSRSIETVMVRSAPNLGIAPADIRITPSDGGGPGEIVRIEVRTEFDFLLPFVAPLLPNGRLEIRANTIVENERYWSEPVSTGGD